MSLVRSEWDEGTAGVMQRAGVEGADIEFKRKKVVALKPKQKPRGWEARHSSTKYKPIWRHKNHL
jgi:large subunit ribosomal protein L35